MITIIIIIIIIVVVVVVMITMIIIIILSFDIAPFPYKHAQRHITFHCQLIRIRIHTVICNNCYYVSIFEQMGVSKPICRGNIR